MSPEISEKSSNSQIGTQKKLSTTNMGSNRTDRTTTANKTGTSAVTNDADHSLKTESNATDQKVVASKTEMCLKNNVAPEMISPKGQVSILLIYSILIAVSIFGITSLHVYYSTDLFLTPEFTVH